jgi:hypothetical protein
VEFLDGTAPSPSIENTEYDGGGDEEIRKEVVGVLA